MAQDASGATSNVATGYIYINCVNTTAPVAVNQSITINEDNTGSISFTSGSSDGDLGDMVSFSGFITSPASGTITTG